MARRRRFLLAALLTVALLPGAAAGATRTYSTGPLAYPIPDVGTLDVPLGVLEKGPVWYLQVWVRIDHPRDSDLTLSLVSPSGTTILLSAKRGGNGRDYGTGPGCSGEETHFAPERYGPIARAKAPFDDWYSPEQPLSRLYREEAAGVWKLRIRDDTPGAAGRIRCFSLYLSRNVVQSQSARLGSTEARLSYRERSGAYPWVRLRIARSGNVLFDAAPKRLRECRTCGYEGPLVWTRPGRALHVRNLDGDREPEVFVDLYWGGVHCCFYTDVYRYLPRLPAYRLTVGFWGNLQPKVVDLDRDGRPEFRTGDDRFAYVFSCFACSAFPIRIFRFDHGRFVDVTRGFPNLVRRDAAQLWPSYRAELRKPGVVRSVGGILPAWLADQYLLGRGPAGWPVVRRAVRRGELRSFEQPRTYLRKVRFFLRHTGYIRT